MVEMTPDHLEAQVEMELQQNEDLGDAEATGSIADFSVRLIEKKAKEDPEEHSAPALPVDPLSLSSLLSQGFEEGPARRALRMHQNNTQAALDWLIDGGTEETVQAKKAKAAEDGVRMPTTVKRVQKLKAMRKAQQEKLKRRNSSRERDRRNSSRGSSEPDDGEGSGRDDGGGSKAREEEPAKRQPVQVKKPPEPVNLMEVDEAPTSAPPAQAQDLLGFGGEEPPAEPTDFSKPMQMAPLPQLDIFYDGGARCEMEPLPASVAAGIVKPRGEEAPPTEGLLGLTTPAATPAVGTAGLSPELLAQVQVLAAQSQISPQQLLAAAAQQQQASQPSMPTPMSGYPAMGFAPGPTAAQAPSTGVASFTSPASGEASTGFAALDPFQGLSGGAQERTSQVSGSLPATSNGAGESRGGEAEKDQFSGLVGLVNP
jgi:hypothetical protein